MRNSRQELRVAIVDDQVELEFDRLLAAVPQRDQPPEIQFRIHENLLCPRIEKRGERIVAPDDGHKIGIHAGIEIIAPERTRNSESRMKHERGKILTQAATARTSAVRFRLIP